MNLLLSALIGHLLSEFASSLASEEPAIVAAIEQELKLLIMKLESFLQKKSPTVSAVITPILNTVNTVADASITAAGNAAVGVQTPQSSN